MIKFLLIKKRLNRVYVLQIEVNTKYNCMRKIFVNSIYEDYKIVPHQIYTKILTYRNIPWILEKEQLSK